MDTAVQKLKVFATKQITPNPLANSTVSLKVLIITLAKKSSEPIPKKLALRRLIRHRSFIGPPFTHLIALACIALVPIGIYYV